MITFAKTITINTPTSANRNFICPHRNDDDDDDNNDDDDDDDNNNYNDNNNHSNSNTDSMPPTPLKY